jgi:hypothetical protein
MTAAKALVLLRWLMMKRLALQSRLYTTQINWVVRSLLTNQLHALKAKEAASKRRASVVVAAEAVAVVMAAAEAVAVAAAVADTTAIVVATVVAVDTTGINSTHQSNYSSPAFAGLFYYGTRMTRKKWIVADFVFTNYLIRAHPFFPRHPCAISQNYSGLIL